KVRKSSPPRIDKPAITLARVTGPRAALRARMLRRLVVILALVSVTACTIPKQARPAAVIGGAVMVVAGLVIAAPEPVDSDGDGINFTLLNDDWSGFWPGTLLYVVGATLMGSAIK